MNSSLKTLTPCSADIRMPRPERNGMTVVCICGGFGFPNGAGSTARIRIVGKCLQEAGIGLLVLHCGPSPIASNTERRGVHEGVVFEYTTALVRPVNAVMRGWVYLRALAVATARLVRLRRMRARTAVWLYMSSGPVVLYVSWLCLLLGLPVIQEYCEWWPTNSCASALTRWAYRRPLIRSATGVLAISRVIEDRVRDLASSLNPHLLIHRLPSIVEARRFEGNNEGELSADSAGSFVWCGTEQWVQDVLFLLGALAQVRRRGYAATITIVGALSAASRGRIVDHAAGLGLPGSALNFTGYVDDEALAACYRNAAALLLPLPDNEQSWTRMPNKLGEYLASGRPVITNGLGDLREFLSHDVNAYLSRPGDESDFAERMIEVLSDPSKARVIGRAGREACRKHLDYHRYSRDLAEWIRLCSASRGAVWL